MSKMFLALALLTAVSLPVAEAKWFGKDKKEVTPAEQLETFQPPPADAIERYCEPIRREVVLLNSRSRLERIMLHPRIAMLRRQHEKCKADLMEQEMEYLRHVDIRQPPSLPKIEAQPSAAAPVPAPKPDQTGITP